LRNFSNGSLQLFTRLHRPCEHRALLQRHYFGKKQSDPFEKLLNEIENTIFI
jgi:hypothetical protein